MLVDLNANNDVWFIGLIFRDVCFCLSVSEQCPALSIFFTSLIACRLLAFLGSVAFYHKQRSNKGSLINTSCFTHLRLLASSSSLLKGLRLSSPPALFLASLWWAAYCDRLVAPSAVAAGPFDDCIMVSPPIMHSMMWFTDRGE